MNNRIFKLINKVKSYKEFEAIVIKYLKWYEIPKTWTKVDLKAFYILVHGR